MIKRNVLIKHLISERERCVKIINNIDNLLLMYGIKKEIPFRNINPEIEISAIPVPVNKYVSSKEKTCLLCGKSFKPTGNRQVFCSKTCLKTYNKNNKKKVPLPDDFVTEIKVVDSKSENPYNTINDINEVARNHASKNIKG